MTKGNREEIAAYVFEDRERKFGKKFKRYKVSLYWLVTNNIPLDSPCVSRISDPNKGYVHRYKFQSGFED